ncbi:methyltransferase domain-containing protein [Methyloversatilis sp.]|uniref:methyltransferase domain-containing protein n=1 Tax=Methyloversatilis sp. TaxID=2569862 RepID=UPI002733EC45|nr:methyltransferase domain-containing protein [Methyloversatilis sp.]MDP2870176.1 methyltransferase domain-containing protein [Methyloversatilis sp.]MDP3289368.1 methyltransferase domain-containing protein [Methyloversatilis sp.]MDP3456045.1 methyltransferase domain-containing protein [Methyloversatilis sp.]MDP3580244.1 methyltransferase domain-containing protein [Methyloversatilis sp.]
MTELAAVRRSFSRAADRYAASAGLQRQVSDRLLDMLPSTAARRVLDLGCGTGFASAGLRGRYPDALLLSADFAPAMLCAHAPMADNPRVCADAHALPLCEGSVDLIFSSLMLQWCDLSRSLPECRRVLRPGAPMCFATVLDGTLREIDLAFAAVDRHRHTLPFLDQAALVAALGTAGLVVDHVERSRQVEYFNDARSLLQSNRDIGASRVPLQARRTTMGRAAWESVCAAFDAQRAPLGIPLTYELAWVVAHRPRHGDTG